MTDARLKNILNPQALQTVELLDNMDIDTGVIKRNLNQRHHRTLSCLIGDLVDEATRQFQSARPGTRFEGNPSVKQAAQLTQ